MPACRFRQDATGIKLKKKATFRSTITTTEYMDTSALLSTSGFQYKNTALDFFPTAEGYVKVLASGGGTSYNYVFNYTDHSCLRRGLITDEGGTTERVMAGREEGIIIRAKYTQDPNDGMVTLIEENQYYPSCLRRGRPDREEGIIHLSYNPDHSVFEVGVGGNVIITPVTPLLGDSYTYKFGGKEQQTEFNINTYDFGARNYDPALGRWMNVDPLAEIAPDKTPYHFVSNNPINRIDPDGLTDYTINKKTGDVTQIGEANDEPDRVLKTNRKGEVKYNRKGEAKVAIGDIEQGILQDGMNLKDESNAIEVGGDGQPTEQGVESFALKLSDYVGKEIGGAYFSKGGSENTTHITIGAYGNNEFKKTTNHGITVFRQFSSTAEEFTSSLRGFFHTHPSGAGIKDSDRLVPSGADRRSRDRGLEANSNLKYFLLTHPDYGGKFPRKIPYHTGYPTSNRR